MPSSGRTLVLEEVPSGSRATLVWNDISVAEATIRDVHSPFEPKELPGCLADTHVCVTGDALSRLIDAAKESSEMDTALNVVVEHVRSCLLWFASGCLLVHFRCLRFFCFLFTRSGLACTVVCAWLRMRGCV